MIEFSKHALFQIKRRGISKKLVVATVRNPKYKQLSFRGRILRQMRLGDKMLEVVTKAEGSKIIVITAYFLERKSRNEN